VSDTQTESATANQSDGASDANDIKEKLAKSGLLSGLLADEHIKKTLLAELRDLGFKPPLHHLAFRLITSTASKSESFIGKSITSRLAAFIDRQPKLAGLLQRLINIQHGEKTKDALKNSVLTAITDGRTVDTSDINIDSATSLETMLALYNVQGQDKILNAIDDQTSTLIETFRQDITNAFQSDYAPVLSWPETAHRPQNLGAFDRVKYTSGLDELYGRNDEITLLHQFVGDLSLCGPIFNFRWMLLTGDGGTGKTRLAYDFTQKKLNSAIWDAGRLSIKDLQSASNIAKWRPQKPTFIVIDYVASQPKETGNLLRNFASQAKHYDFPVRVLLLERKADENWLNQMIPPNGDDIMILNHVFGHEDKNGFPIPPVDETAIIQMMRGRFIKDGKTPPDDETLLSAAKKVDTRPNDSGLPRPLFALATADALMAEADEDSQSNTEQIVVQLTQEDVLEGMLKREEYMHWRPAAKDEKGVLQRYKLALALATLQQEVLDFNDLASKEADYGATLARYLPDPPPDENTHLILALSGTGTFLPPLEPDIMGEYFLAKTLMEDIPKHRHTFLNAVLEKGKVGSVITLLRMQQDFPQKIAEIDLPSAMQICNTEQAAYTYSFLAPNYTTHYLRSNAIPAANNFLNGIQGLTNKFPESNRITLQEAKAVFNATNAALKNGDWVRVDDMLARLDTLRSQFSDHPEIALPEARAALNVINAAGEKDDWVRVDDMLARLDTLRSQFSDHPEIALHEARAALNVINAAGEKGEWVRIDDMLARLDTLRSQFSDHPEIAVEKARAAVNIINAAGEKGDGVRVDDMLARLDALRNQFSDHPEIALREAMAAVNVINTAGEKGDWVRVDDMLTRLDALRNQFSDHPEIALYEAMAAVNVTSDAGEKGEWVRVDDMLARLDTLCNQFNDHPEIALYEAMAAVNVTSDAREKGGWVRVDDMLARLDVLRNQFSDHPEIAFHEAMAAFNIINAAEEKSEWVRIDDMLTRLDALRNQFSDHPEIALQQAMAAVNVINAAGEKGDRVRVDDMLARLDALRNQFSDHPEIAVEEVRAAVNLTNAAGKNSDWDRVGAMLERLNTLADKFGTELVLSETNDDQTLTLEDMISYVTGILSLKPE
jgi:hypothetical protein